MAGPASFASDPGFVTRARQQLDTIASAVSAMESAQRTVIAALVELWPTSGWLAAGCRTPKVWLRAHTGQSSYEAARLEAVAKVCTRSDVLLDAVVSGVFPIGWADKLARVVTDERAPGFTDEFVQALLDQIGQGLTEDVFEDILRHFKDLVDQELKPRNVHPHTLTTSRSLFGGGEIHGQLAPTAFAAVETALRSFRPDPDPAGSPIQRTFGQLSADALEDLARFGTAHTDCHDDVGNDPDDTYNGMSDRDMFDELLDLANEADDDDLSGSDEWADEGDRCDDDAFGPDWDHPDWNDDRDPWTSSNENPDGEQPHQHPHGGADTAPGYGPLEMEALRRHLQNQLLHPPHRNRRIVQPRSGVRINLVVDPYTASGTRPLDDLDGFVLRGEGFNLTKAALEQFLCDSAIVTTAMAGNGRILDANADREQFTARQRRAIAARDRHCVFPGCDRPPQHCDAHHLEFRQHGGPTTVANGCLLCRFHHRLIHQHGWTLHQDDDGAWVATDTHGHAWKIPRPTDVDAP